MDTANLKVAFRISLCLLAGFLCNHNKITSGCLCFPSVCISSAETASPFGERNCLPVLHKMEAWSELEPLGITLTQIIQK